MEEELEDGAPVAAYNTGLRAPVSACVSVGLPKAPVHRSEFAKVLAGEPVEINPSVGAGFKVMTVAEYTSRWKRNDDFPDCLSCGSLSTREHHFTQSWCRGRRMWESETFCDACHSWSWRSYVDPEFLLPEVHEKLLWQKMLAQQPSRAQPLRPVSAA